LNPRQKKYYLLLVGITVLALAIRLFAGWQMYKNDPAVTTPISETDMHTYLAYGRQFKNGTYTDFGGAYYYQPFYSAVYLNGLFRIFGESVLAVVFSQAFLGALTVLLTGLVGSLLGGRKAGVVAALMLTFLRNHILYTPFALIAIVQTFFITLSIYLLILAFKKEKCFFWISSGLAISCSILCRGNLLLIVPVIILFILLKYKKNYQKSFVIIGVFCLAIYLPQLPFSIKNYQVTGKWTGPSTAGSRVLSIGNNPDAPPGTIDIEDSHYIQYDEYQEVHHWPADKLKENVSAWISAHPLQWLELKWRTLLLYFSHNESFNNITLKESVKFVPWLDAPWLIDSWLAVLLFLSASFRLYRKKSFGKRRRTLVFTIVFIYVLSVVLFYVLTRYRLPIVPLMCVFAGREIFDLIRDLKLGDKRQRFLCVSRLILGFWIVFRLFDLYRFNLEAPVHAFLEPNGRLFSTEKYTYASDSNFLFWGGWMFYGIQPQDIIEKSFAVSDTDASHGLLRIYGGAKTPGRVFIKVIYGEKSHQVELRFPYPRGDWFEIPLKDLNPTESLIKLKIEINTDCDFSLCYTPQRDFERSTLNGNKLGGEWVMQLRVAKNQE
jgi:4-amino-4-deoxy-L-arabinose transferase-like glycosyltransferase